jgi:hypothetical protein
MDEFSNGAAKVAIEVTKDICKDILANIAKFGRNELSKISIDWPAPGFKDTQLRCFMKLEMSYGTTSVYAGVQA